jgi:hypothetical protein
MRIQQQLRQAYDRAAAAEPHEAGAYDRFLDRRARHDRAVAVGTSLALAAALVLALVVPRILADRQPTIDRPPPRPLPSDLVILADQGLELRVPDGWTVRQNDELGLQLVPTAVATGDPVPGAGVATIILETRVLDPRIYPGRPGPPNSGVQQLLVPGALGERVSIGYSVPQGPFTSGRRADGRRFIRSSRSDRLGGPWSQDYLLAWPYRCAKAARCPAAAQYRALLVAAASPLADRGNTQAAQLRVVETVRPIGNAAGGAEPVSARRDCRITKPTGYAQDVAAEPLGSQPRDAHQIGLGLQLRTERFVPCRLHLRVTLEVREGGQLAKVQGNRSTVQFDGGMPEGAGGTGSFSAGWRWRNWCGSRSVSLRYVGLEGLEQSPSELRPRCLNPAKPSTLELVEVHR